MSHIGETETSTEPKSDQNILKTICAFQESNPSESVSILRAFLHLTNPIHQSEYSNDFVDHQLSLLQRSSSLTPSLFELLKQLVPSSKLVRSFNVVRQSTVELFVGQFRKDTQKQKWGGNGEKIQLLARSLERSLDPYCANDEPIKSTSHEWYSTVLNFFEPLMDELNEYLKSKLHKQQHQQYSSLSYLIKPLSQLSEQLNRADGTKSGTDIQEHFSNIVLTNLQQRIDFILTKKIFDQFESFEKLEVYTCPIRHTIFSVYPDVSKLLVFLDDASVSKTSRSLIQRCNQKLDQLLEKASKLCHNYPSSTSLEHCVCLISSLSSIEIFFRHEHFQFFLYDFCQFMLTYWKMNLLHDGDADDWSNTKAYFENQRYSVYIDTLFHHFNRLHFYFKQYCPSLLPIVIPYMLLELMNFVYHRYASVTISYARQPQYRADLLGFLVHASEFSHYFPNRTSLSNEFLLLQNDQIESKFIEYGNAILAAAILVTCPCDVLHDQLGALVRDSGRTLINISWLNIIRPDWFDSNHELRMQVQTFFVMKNMIETRQIHFYNRRLVTLLIDNSELDPYQSLLIELIMKNEQWELIDLFVKRQRDWSFMQNSSTKLPEWLTTMMKYWTGFFAKCCYLCATETEISWRGRIQQVMSFQNPVDEKSVYLRTLQQYLANIPLSLHQLFIAINQHHPQFTKRLVGLKLPRPRTSL